MRPRLKPELTVQLAKEKPTIDALVDKIKKDISSEKKLAVLNLSQVGVIFENNYYAKVQYEDVSIYEITETHPLRPILDAIPNGTVIDKIILEPERIKNAGADDDANIIKSVKSRNLFYLDAFLGALTKKATVKKYGYSKEPTFESVISPEFLENFKITYGITKLEQFTDIKPNPHYNLAMGLDDSFDDDDVIPEQKIETQLNPQLVELNKKISSHLPKMCELHTEITNKRPKKKIDEADTVFNELTKQFTKITDIIHPLILSFDKLRQELGDDVSDGDQDLISQIREKKKRYKENLQDVCNVLGDVLSPKEVEKLNLSQYLIPASNMPLSDSEETIPFDYSTSQNNTANDSNPLSLASSTNTIEVDPNTLSLLLGLNDSNNENNISITNSDITNKDNEIEKSLQALWQPYEELESQDNDNNETDINGILTDTEIDGASTEIDPNDKFDDLMANISADKNLDFESNSKPNVSNDADVPNHATKRKWIKTSESDTENYPSDSEKDTGSNNNNNDSSWMDIPADESSILNDSTVKDNDGNPNNNTSTTSTEPLITGNLSELDANNSIDSNLNSSNFTDLTAYTPSSVNESIEIIQEPQSAARIPAARLDMLFSPSQKTIKFSDEDESNFSNAEDKDRSDSIVEQNDMNLSAQSEPEYSEGSENNESDQEQSDTEIKVKNESEEVENNSAHSGRTSPINSNPTPLSPSQAIESEDETNSGSVTSEESQASSNKSLKIEDKQEKIIEPFNILYEKGDFFAGKSQQDILKYQPSYTAKPAYSKRFNVNENEPQNILGGFSIRDVSQKAMDKLQQEIGLTESEVEQMNNKGIYLTTDTGGKFCMQRDVPSRNLKLYFTKDDVPVIEGEDPQSQQFRIMKDMLHMVMQIVVEKRTVVLFGDDALADAAGMWLALQLRDAGLSKLNIVLYTKPVDKDSFPTTDEIRANHRKIETKEDILERLNSKQREMFTTFTTNLTKQTVKNLESEGVKDFQQVVQRFSFFSKVEKKHKEWEEKEQAAKKTITAPRSSS